jgi:hypothetical protein
VKACDVLLEVSMLAESDDPSFLAGIMLSFAKQKKG